MKNSNNGGVKTDGRRVSRVEKEVQSIVSSYIIQNLQSELPGLVTIGRVQIPADLRLAKVYVSILNINDGSSDASRADQLDKAIHVLQSWAKDIQDEIGKKLKMKYLPKLTFYADESTEKILKIEKILSGINPQQAIEEDEDN